MVDVDVGNASDERRLAQMRIGESWRETADLQRPCEVEKPVTGFGDESATRFELLSHPGGAGHVDAIAEFDGQRRVAVVNRNGRSLLT